MYKFGTVVLVPFPFTDLTSMKLRPALIVSKTDPKNSDVIVVFITSQKSPKKMKEYFLLKASNKDFSQSGLKVDSIFRFDKIATLHKKLILGELGLLSHRLLKQMAKSFFAAFGWRA